jgi:hypothetical protein
VGLGGRHAGGQRQVLQRQRPARAGQRQQQPAADLDALDAALHAAVVVFGGMELAMVRGFYLSESIRH